MSIASRAEVKAILNITNTNYDTLIDSLLTPLSAFIASYCGIIIEETTYTNEYFSGDGSKILFIDSKCPISSVTALTIDDETVDVINLITKPNYIQISDDISNVFTEGINNIKMTFKAGYASASMPSDLKLALAQLIDLEINQSRARGVSSKSTISGDTVNYSNSMPVITRMILNRYKNQTMMVF